MKQEARRSGLVLFGGWWSVAWRQRQFRGSLVYWWCGSKGRL